MSSIKKNKTKSLKSDLLKSEQMEEEEAERKMVKAKKKIPIGHFNTDPSADQTIR